MSLKEETVSANAAFEQHVERLLSFNARVEHAIDAEISAADRQHRTRAATRVAAREAVRTKLKAAVQGGVQAGLGTTGVSFIAEAARPVGWGNYPAFDSRRVTLQDVLDDALARGRVVGQRPHGALLAEARRCAQQKLLDQIPGLVREVLGGLGISVRWLEDDVEDRDD